MARTAITPSAFVRNGNVVDPAGTAGDTANGHIVESVSLHELVLRVVNGSGASIDATVQGGPSNLQLDGAGEDDVVAVAAGATQWLGPFESSRFGQADGSLWLDLSDDTTVTVSAFVLGRA